MMSGLAVVGDLTGMWSEATGSVTAGLRGLEADKMADTFDKLLSAMDILDGAMVMATSLAGVKELYEGINTAKAAAEATAHVAMGPIGWGKLALALGAMAVAGGVAFGLTQYTIKANLSNPSEATATAQMIGAIA